MPGTKYPDSARLIGARPSSREVYLASPPESPEPTSGQTPRSPAKLQKQAKPQSPDQVEEKPLKSAFLDKNKTRRNKQVGWDLSVIDNEYKMKLHPRPSSAVPSKVTKQSGNTGDHSHTLSSPSMVSVVGASTTMVPSSSRPPITSPKTSISISSSIPSKHTMSPEQRPNQAPATPTLPRRVDHGTSSVQRLTSPAVTTSQAPKREVPTHRPHTNKTQVLPPVPDAPRLRHSHSPRPQQPPPTPRPSRLPSPDLLDIRHRKFCACRACKTKNPDGPDRHIYLKMDAQLQLAMAYMKKRNNQ